MSEVVVVFPPSLFMDTVGDAEAQRYLLRSMPDDTVRYGSCQWNSHHHRSTQLPGDISPPADSGANQKLHTTNNPSHHNETVGGISANTPSVGEELVVFLRRAARV